MNNEVIEKVKKAVSKTARKAVKISGDALDFTKIKLKIAELNAKLDEKYAAIGMAVYEGNDSEEIDKICEDISDLREEINELKIKLAEYKNKKTCTVCGKAADKDASFCQYCGTEF